MYAGGVFVFVGVWVFARVHGHSCVSTAVGDLFDLVSIWGLFVFGGVASADSRGYTTENTFGVLYFIGDVAGDDAGVDEFEYEVVELPSQDVVQVFEGDPHDDCGGVHHEEAV